MNGPQKAEIAAYERKIAQAIRNEQGHRRTGRKFIFSSFLRMRILAKSNPVICSQEIEKYMGRILKLKAAL